MRNIYPALRVTAAGQTYDRQAMAHLVRAGVLLVVLVGGLLYMHTLAGIVTFPLIGLTHEDNARAWAERPVNAQDPGTCAECHNETEEWKKGIHVSVTCEDCHGATREHVEKARDQQLAALPLTDAHDLCLMCHARIPGRPESFPQVDAKTHPDQLAGVSASCASCHTPHNPGIPVLIPHTLDGRSACLECHGGKEPWKPVPPDHVNRTNDQCLKCHELKQVK